MKVVKGTRNLPKVLSPAVLTIGNFDGVHLGHQEIFRRVKMQAKGLKGTSAVYTFDPHPAKVIVPGDSPRLIMTTRQKISAIESCGIDICVIEDFTQELAKMSAEDFFDRIVIETISPKKIVVGHDLTFGRHRLGTTELLDKLCKKHGIGLEIVEAQLLGEVLLSSTHIRELIGRGSVDAARKMLGRPFALEGKVVHGRGIGGQIGIHTANITVENELIPHAGVYVTRAMGKRSVTNIGYNPTFGGSTLTVETHILNFDGDIYGKAIEIEFFKRLRAEMVFKRPEALKKQIENDIKTAVDFFNKEGL